VELDRIPGRGGRLPAEIQPCGPHSRLGYESPAVFAARSWGWTKNKQKHNLNHVPGLTHGLDQKSEPDHLQKAFSGTADFSPQNVWYMRSFYLLLYGLAGNAAKTRTSCERIGYIGFASAHFENAVGTK